MYKQTFRYWLFALAAMFVFAGVYDSFGQTQRIYAPCVNTSVKAEIKFDAAGNIIFVPCPSKTILVNGVPLSGGGGGSGNVTTTGTNTGFVPYFSSNTALLKSTLSYNANLFKIFDAANYYAEFNRTTKRFNVLDSTDNNEGLVYDLDNSFFTLDANNVRLGKSGGSTNFIVDAVSGTITTKTGDTFRHLGNFELNGELTLGLNANLFLDRTITGIGTTGNVTINKIAGTVNVAAGTNAVTVTNSRVTINSIIQVTARTNDLTCYVKNYVPANGSFTVNLTANCNAATSFGFIVSN